VREGEAICTWERERSFSEGEGEDQPLHAQKSRQQTCSTVPKAESVLYVLQRPYYFAALPEFKFWLRNRGFLLAGRCDLAQKSRQPV